MEENYDVLIEILEHSVKKNGEVPLTNKYLLNILKMVERKISHEADRDNIYSFDPDWD
jgi:hypothetical protein